MCSQHGTTDQHDSLDAIFPFGVLISTLVILNRAISAGCTYVDLVSHLLFPFLSESFRFSVSFTKIRIYYFWLLLFCGSCFHSALCSVQGFIWCPEICNSPAEFLPACHLNVLLLLTIPTPPAPRWMQMRTRIWTLHGASVFSQKAHSTGSDCSWSSDWTLESRSISSLALRSRSSPGQSCSCWPGNWN